MVLDHWHKKLLDARQDVEFGDMSGPDVDIGFVTLKWDRFQTHGTQAATITDDAYWMSFSFGCRSEGVCKVCK